MHIFFIHPIQQRQVLNNFNNLEIPLVSNIRYSHETEDKRREKEIIDNDQKQNQYNVESVR